MRSEVLPVSSLTARDIAAWAELGAGAVAPNPFAEPDFVLPAARAWGAQQLGVLAVRNGSGWLAALPVVNVRAWRNVPGRCLAGWRHSYCYLGTPLVRGDDAGRVLAALIRGGLRGSNCLALDWINADGPLVEPLADALGSVARVVVLEQFERAALVRDQLCERPLAARHTREYRRKLKQLEREVGNLTVRDESDAHASYQRFLELERSGWKGEAGTALASRPGHGEFFLQVCEQFARSGRFLMQSLASDTRTIAMRNELVCGDTSFTFKIAFDEQFSRYSPGMQLEIANLERFASSELNVSDSCTAPENATLNRLWPGRLRLQSVVATPRQALGAGNYAKWRAAAAALPLRRKLTRAPTGIRGH